MNRLELFETNYKANGTKFGMESGTSLLHIIQVSIQVLFSLDQVHVEVSTSKLTARISQMVAFDRVDGWFADTSIIQQLCLAPSSV